MNGPAPDTQAGSARVHDLRRARRARQDRAAGPAGQAPAARPQDAAPPAAVDAPAPGGTVVPALRTSARGPVVAGFVLFLCLFGLGGAWGAMAQLSGAVIASGRVNVVGEPRTVQHLDGGVVAEIGVANGAAVRAGDTLLRLDDGLLLAARTVHEGRLAELVATRARLVAERDGADTITFGDAALDRFGLALPEPLRAGQVALFAARRSTIEGQLDLLDQRIAQAESRIVGAQRQAASLERQVALVAEELAGVESLDEQGLTTTNRLMLLRRQGEELLGQAARLDAEIDAARNAREEAAIQKLQTRRQFQEAVLDELRQIEQTIASTSFDLQSTLHRLDRVEVRAPSDGIVHALAVTTVGAVIAPGERLMQIIPQDGNLEVIGQVEPQFVDELFADQPATLRFAAFDAATTPELAGRLTFISPDVVVDRQTGFASYEVRLHVEPGELERLGGRAIIPGMPVDVFITTRARSFWDYLTRPLTNQFNRAFRES